MSDVGAKPRRWHQGVAGRLLIAFLLIVALTVAGTVLSIFRFSTLNLVLHRLVDVSLPAVKIALEIEARAIQVTGAASQLRNAEDGVALFGQTRSERNGTWNPADISLSRLDQCVCHYERRCRRNDPFIDDIGVEDVIAAVERRVVAR